MNNSKSRCPRVFIHWHDEENEFCIKEHYFDVNGSLADAQVIAKNISDFMDARNIDYIGCYATTLYLN